MKMLSRGRLVMALAAVAFIAIGLLSKAGSGTTSPAAPATVSTTAVTGDSFNFSVRDYSELSGGPGADLPSSDWLGVMAGTVMRLLLVIVLIYAAFWAFRRYFYRGPGALIARKKPIFLLASLNLSQNRTVYVVECARKALVLGATANQISLLSEVTDTEVIEEMRLLSADSPGADQFTSLLSAFKRRLGDPGHPPADTSAEEDH